MGLESNYSYRGYDDVISPHVGSSGMYTNYLPPQYFPVAVAVLVFG